MMKYFRKSDTPTAPVEPADDLPSPLSAKEYQALPSDKKAAYRPIDPRYERLPLPCIILYGVALLSLIFYILFRFDPAFADWFNLHISSVPRAILATLTVWLPFSLGEAVIWLLPLFIILILRHAIRWRCDTWRTAAVYMGILGSVGALIFSLFVLNFAAGYQGSTLDQKLGIKQDGVSAQELYDTAVILIDKINEEAENVDFYEQNFSAMPYSLTDMNGHLAEAYDSFTETYDFIADNPGRPKPVLASEVMSYLHITGVYSFFTGEANINVNFPDYTIPYTAAHEMAHQRGVAREDEANFVAFLVCMESTDAYVRYSGYVGLYEYVANALWQADRDLYYEALSGLSQDVRYELIAYSEFYDQYRDSTVSNISSSVNNSFLQSQGTPGIKSYGMVVDLAVAYFCD